MHLIKYFETHNRAGHLNRARHLQLVPLRRLAKRLTTGRLLPIIVRRRLRPDMSFRRNSMETIPREYDGAIKI